MNKRILIDASPLIALFDPSDNYHNIIKDYLKKNEYRFISTVAVYAEVLHQLNFSSKYQQLFFEWVMQRGIILADINQHDIPRIAELMKKYEDLPMDFADATLLVTAEKTDIMEIISFDKDFEIYRVQGNKKLGNPYLSYLLNLK